MVLLPTVVVQDELRSGVLTEYCAVPELFENFYAITVQRRFEPALLDALLNRPESEVLGTAGATHARKRATPAQRSARSK